MLYANCGICGNESGYDEKSLKGSTWNINGINIVLCCPCEDELKRSLNYYEIKCLKGILDRCKDEVSGDNYEDLVCLLSSLKGKVD